MLLFSLVFLVALVIAVATGAVPCSATAMETLFLIFFGALTVGVASGAQVN